MEPIGSVPKFGAGNVGWAWKPWVKKATFGLLGGGAASRISKRPAASIEFEKLRVDWVRVGDIYNDIESDYFPGGHHYYSNKGNNDNAFQSPSGQEPTHMPYFSGSIYCCYCPLTCSIKSYCPGNSICRMQCSNPFCNRHRCLIIVKVYRTCIIYIPPRAGILTFQRTGLQNRFFAKPELACKLLS